MAHFIATSHGAFRILTGIDAGRTASLLCPNLRPLSADEQAGLAAMLRVQSDVVARLCADALASWTFSSHGGLLTPDEAVRLRPAKVYGPAGEEEPPSWTEQGRARLLEALKHESGLIRLVGVTSKEGCYWIYTGKDLERYVGGIRVGEGTEALRRLLYENLPLPGPVR